MMGKKLSKEQIARSVRERSVTRKGGSRPSPGWRLGCALLLLGVILAGCASGDSSSDQERRGGFYGGVFGGMSHP